MAVRADQRLRQSLPSHIERRHQPINNADPRSTSEVISHILQVANHNISVRAKNAPELLEDGA
jgi:hypothetical protein